MVLACRNCSVKPARCSFRGRIARSRSSRPRTAHVMMTQVTRSLREEADQLVIIASDGLWDVFSNKDACALASAKFEEELAASGNVRAALKKAASALAKAALTRGSRDNVTVLVADVRMSQAPIL